MDKLSSYHNHLKHALAKQENLRRQTQYHQPNWSQVIEVFQIGKPTTIADLHALVLDHLSTVKSEIKQSNTDRYKVFWNVEGNDIKEPLNEEVCRDRLIDYLRPEMRALEIHVEPEGHMAADKRTDIVFMMLGNIKLPIECKRDTHPDLWKACKNQLERLYARDPESSGYGIYLVFWFGTKRNGRISKPPIGIDVPTTAEELEISLQSLIPGEHRSRIEVVVIDVTPPADKSR